MDLSEKYRMKFILLPPKNAHLTQPLDVSVFRPMKLHWRKIVEDQKQTNNVTTISKAAFPGLLKIVLDKGAYNMGDNIRHGFWKCGIVPLC